LDGGVFGIVFLEAGRTIGHRYGDMHTFVLGPGDALVKITVWFDKKDGGMRAMTLLSHSGNTITFGDLDRVPKREREHVLNAPAGHVLFALFGASSAHRIGLTNFGVYHRAATLQSAAQMIFLKQLRKGGHAGAYTPTCLDFPPFPALCAL
jgi:hypothetical protein